MNEMRKLMETTQSLFGESIARKETDRAIEMAEEGLISWEDLAVMALKYMSEDDVADMLDANELSDRFLDEKENKISENNDDIFKGHDIEDLTTRLEVSHRGGGIEIDLEPLGYPEGARMSAYQNYLGGGMLGSVQSDCNLKDWQYIDGLDEISEHLKRHFHNLTNPEGDDWVDFDYEQNQAMPASAY